MLIGAIIGALLVLKVAIAAALALAAATVLTVGLASRVLSHSQAPWVEP